MVFYALLPPTHAPSNRNARTSPRGETRRIRICNAAVSWNVTADVTNGRVKSPDDLGSFPRNSFVSPTHVRNTLASLFRPRERLSWIFQVNYLRACLWKQAPRVFAPFWNFRRRRRFNHSPYSLSSLVSSSRCLLEITVLDSLSDLPTFIDRFLRHGSSIVFDTVVIVVRHCSSSRRFCHRWSRFFGISKKNFNMNSKWQQWQVYYNCIRKNRNESENIYLIETQYATWIFSLNVQ